VHVADRGVGGDAHDHRRDVEVTARILQPSALRGGQPRIDRVARREHARQVAVPVDERRSGLLPDPGHAGQAVARVAAQHRHVRVRPPGRDRIPLDEPRLVDDLEVPDPLDRVQDAHPRRVVDQLEQVPVPRHDLDRRALADRARHLARDERADHVVRLVPRRADPRDPERREHVHDHGDLCRERRRHVLLARRPGHLACDTVRLVRRDRGDPERRAPVVVPAGHQTRRPVVDDEPGDHVEQPPHGVDRRAVGSPHRVRHPVERTEVQRSGVEQEQLPRSLGHAGHATPPSAGATRAAPRRITMTQGRDGSERTGAT
jgi:hypothetical protein